MQSVLADSDLAKTVRDKLLSEAADRAWATLFPEDRNPELPRLTSLIRKQRWNQVIEQLSMYPDKEKILRILESPASGERFYWLDK